MTISNVNRQVVLASRPIGAPTSSNFSLKTGKKPVIKENQILLRTVYLSLDPYMRGRMSDQKSYAEPVAINEVMVGATVCQVEESNLSKYKIGDWVLAYSGWQDYLVSDGVDLLPLGSNPTSPSYALGIMGMPGFTAYMGLLDIGEPKEGETVVVAAATGPVGATVGQIAKLKGCKAIGIAGGTEKCTYAKEVLGFDECIDHKANNFAEELARVCNQGIDVYYENVGGKVFDAVLPLLNTKARIPVCGLISQYNATELPSGPNRMGELMGNLLIKRIKMQGFIIFEDYAHRYNEFAKDMSQWLAEDKIQYKEQITESLESAPKTFIGLLNGENFGKAVIQVNKPL